MNLTTDVQRIDLNIVDFECFKMVNWPFAESPKVTMQDRKDFIDWECASMLRMLLRVAEQRECVAEYPRDWVQAIKERFAPAWYLKRWPVKKNRVDMSVVYPRIALPEKGPVVSLHVVQQSDYPWEYENSNV